MTTKSLEWCIKAIIYLTFFIPLVVFPNHFIYPFIFPKVLIFRTLVTLMTAGYMILLSMDWKAYIPKRTPLNYTIGLFLISFTLSSLLGVDPHRSIWDTQERMLGFTTILHYVLYFFICSQIFKTWHEWKIAMNIFLFAGLLVMIIGWFNPYQNPLQINRVIATLGHPVFLGGFCLFLFFISLLLLTETQNLYLRCYYGFSLIIVLMILFFTATRGAVVGIIFGSTLILVSYLLILKNRRIRILLCSLGAVLIISIASLYLTFNQSNLSDDIPAIERLFNISQRDLSSPRIMAWDAAIKGWKDHPFFGWGPNNFIYIFTTHYNPSVLRFGYLETHLDNAHNVFFNTLATQGLIGIISYLAIYLSAIFSLRKSYNNGNINRNYMIFSLGFLLAYFVMNLTVFDNPTSYLYFFFWLASINSLSCKSEEISISKPTSKISLSFSIAFATIIILNHNVLPGLSNQKMFDAVHHFFQHSPVSITKFRETLHETRTPHLDDISFLTAKIIIDSLEQGAGLEKKYSYQLSEIAALALQKSLEMHPQNILIHLMNGKLNKIRWTLTDNKNFLEKARKSLVKGLELSPRFQEMIYHLAFVEIHLGNNDEAIHLFEKSLKEDLLVDKSYEQFIQGCLKMGMKVKADEIYQLAKERGVELNSIKL